MNTPRWVAWSASSTSITHSWAEGLWGQSTRCLSSRVSSGLSSCTSNVDFNDVPSRLERFPNRAGHAWWDVQRLWDGLVGRVESSPTCQAPPRSDVPHVVGHQGGAHPAPWKDSTSYRNRTAPFLTSTTSPTFISRAGLTALSATDTLPSRQCWLAMERVLKTRIAHRNLSTLMPLECEAISRPRRPVCRLRVWQTHTPQGPPPLLFPRSTRKVKMKLCARTVFRWDQLV